MKKLIKRIVIVVVIVMVIFAGYFFTIARLDKGLEEKTGFYIAVQESGTPLMIPSLFIDHERFYIKLPSKKGDTLLAFGDSGGGISMITSQAIDSLGLQNSVHTGLMKAVMLLKYISFSDVAPAMGFLAPQPLRKFALRHPFNRVSAPFLLIPPDDEELKEAAKLMHFDLFLGQNFFMGHSWTFDYPGAIVWTNTPLTTSTPGVQRIGFKKNAAGEKMFGHPSLVIEVDGEMIEVLFDTGASIIVSDSGRTEMGIAPTTKTIGGSFIAASVFDKWRSLHPDWKCYPHADNHEDIIEVPEVKIGTETVGPVKFARRPDEVWSEGMIASMDQVVKGAIGGSAFKYLKVTIDYNTELIRFSR